MTNNTESPVAETGVYRVRPLVEIGDERLPIVQTLLSELVLNEAEGGLSSLEIRLRNSTGVGGSGNGLAFEDEATTHVALGQPVKVFGGDETDPVELFRGTITALEYVHEEGDDPHLIILAEDALQAARMSRRTRLHPAGPLRDLVITVANDLGLSPVITELSDEVDAQMQVNETDLAFLRRLLGRFDADLQIVGSELHISPRREVARGDVTLELNSQLINVRVLADLAHQVTKVSFAGWDVASGERLTADSNQAADLGVGDGRKGSTFISESFGERVEHCGNLAAYDQTEAQALANTLFSRRARQFVTVTATALGNPAIRVGTNVRLEGISPRFANTYYVTEACHRFGLSEGYQTEFIAESAYLGV
ncbi:MAG: phage late control D family protein [Rhizobiales bacterium]|nr:phage late control D family protein [Hyphomicrobiales bacterium]